MTRTDTTTETTFSTNDRVCGGSDADYDEGTVVEVDDDQVTVAWDSLVTTTQPADLLRAL